MTARRIGVQTLLLLVPLLVAFICLLQSKEVGAAATLEQMQQSTVLIFCHSGDGKGSRGSGFVVGEDRATYLITNAHVVGCAETGRSGNLFIVLARGNLVPARVEWKDPERDLAILRSQQALGRPVAQLAETASVKAGAIITVIGFPGAADDVVDTDDIAVPSVTRGNISRVVPGLDGVRYFQHTAATNPGNSGGPVYNEAGDVIAVNSRKALVEVATISDSGDRSVDRVANGEGIALAVDVAELMHSLRAEGVPYVIDRPVSMSLVAGMAAFALLLSVGGTLAATSSGRAVFFRLAAWAKPGDRAKSQAGKLRVLDGPMAGMEVPISARVVVGRDPTMAQLVFPEGETDVSRRHCDIRFDSTQRLFEVRDLGSRNGTFIQCGDEKPRRLPANVIERVGPGHNVLVGSRRNRLVLEAG